MLICGVSFRFSEKFEYKPIVYWIVEENLKFTLKQMANDLRDVFIQAGPTEVRKVILKCI